MNRIEIPQHPPFTVEQFLAGANVSRSFLYGLPEDKRPRWAKINGKRLLLESPMQWLERIAARDEQIAV